VTDLSRYADWTAWLTAQAEADTDVRCVWVGGSAATGGYDEWSDLDLDVLCTPGTSSEVYARWLARARADFDVRDVWEVPLSTWPDGRQCFINLHDRPGLLLEPTRLVDLHVSDLSDQHSRVDVRRHGTPVVLHDPESLVVLTPEDTSAAMAEAVDQVRQRRVTGEWLVNRAIARGHVAEAVDFYLRFALAAVVRLVRVEHCPWRHDFGLRYLRQDLPPEVADRIEELVPGATTATLQELSLRCYAWMDELLAEATAG
jgi:predicted nucleotidyltransferase